MEKSKKPIVVSADFHTKIKHRAVEEDTSIEKIIDKILKKEFNIKGDNNNDNRE